MGHGEYFAVLDADDASLPERLERQVTFLDANPGVVLVGSWATYVDGDGVVVGGWHPPTSSAALIECFAWANPIVHSSSMYRSTAAMAVGGYPLALPYAQDCGLWLPLLEHGKVAILPEVLCHQRIVAASMTRGRRFRADVARDALVLARDARRRLQFTGRAAQRSRDAILIAEVKCSLSLLQEGRWARAAAAVLVAVVRNPLGLFRSRAYRTEYLAR